VLRNLISNGLKFNESARPHVEIGCRGDEPCTIYVRDNGIGIPDEHHDEIFAMFRRLHSRRKYDGTGAGLTIVRKIVESFGGRIRVESAPGCGAMFFVTLKPGVKRERQELATCAVG
jgi:signal transduction histidine kinase